MAAEPDPRRDRTAERPRTFIEQTRRAQIVQSAIDVIAEHGYADATFARIAARIDVSPALISYHFSGRDELVAEVVAEVERRMTTAIEAETADAPSYSAALRRVIETQVRYFASHTSEIVALGSIYSSARHDTSVARQSQQSRESTIAELQGMFVEAQQHGEFSAFDARVVAVSLLATLERVPHELLAHPDLDAEAYGRELADLFERATAERRSRRGR